MTKQWNEITVKELLAKSLEERKECLALTRQASALTRKALKDRSDRHSEFCRAVMRFPKVTTVKALLDAIEAERDQCLSLESVAQDPILCDALRRQGNHYESLFQEIMYFVNKICPEP